MVCLKAELQLPPNISELQGVNGHAAWATGNKHQVRHQVGHLARVGREGE